MRLRFSMAVSAVAMLFARGVWAASLPLKANDFLNSLGIASHMVQGIDAPAQVQAGLQFTGIRNLREDSTRNSTLLAGLCNIHSTTGAMIDELAVPGDVAASLAEYEALAYCGANLAAEGPNEPNNFNFAYMGSTCSMAGSFLACAEFQRDLYRAVKSDPKLAGMPVWSLTEPGAEPDNQGLQFLSIPGGAGTLQPAGTVYADAANCHNYVRGNGQTAIGNNQAWFAESNAQGQGPWDGPDGEYLNSTWYGHFTASPYALGPSISKVTTETGWATDGSITQAQQAKLFVNVYLSAMKLGWSHTFIYQMFDDPMHGNGYYGIFNQNASMTSTISPKASANYIRTMTIVLHDSSSDFTPTALAYSIPNEPATVHDLLMQKSDGTYELAVWADQVTGSNNMTVNLGARFTRVNVYDVVRGTRPVSVFHNASAISLSLSDHAVFLEFHT
jgi:hypothetical protein